jgi:hypothetical protein
MGLYFPRSKRVTHPPEANVKKVTVRVHEFLNLEQSQKVLAAVLTRAGHPQCYSGFNISFENAVDPAEIIMVVERGNQKIMEVGS